MAARDKPVFDHGDLEFAQSKLAESRSKLPDFRTLQNSFNAGSAERMQADSLLKEIEVLHQLMEQLCRQLRARTR
ncbi:MAG TPA: hypothetical protein VJ255_20190 [Candidatus Acidoferrum sp.]|jgi:hypothetical protein|nr:hypothetical protein [Candidatus Acidoferrum sp.]